MPQNQKLYQRPALELEQFETEDIILLSETPPKVTGSWNGTEIELPPQPLN